MGNSPLNLSRGESDIAVRATDNPPENLFGRKVATIAWAPYIALRGAGSAGLDGGALLERPWVSYSGKLASLKACGFLEERVAPERIAYRVDSVAGAAAAVAAGMGAGYLPCMLGDVSPELRRIAGIEPELSSSL